MLLKLSLSAIIWHISFLIMDVLCMNVHEWCQVRVEVHTHIRTWQALIQKCEFLCENHKIANHVHRVQRATPFYGHQILPHTKLDFPRIHKILCLSEIQRCRHSLENHLSCALTTERHRMSTSCFIIQWQIRSTSAEQHLCICDI